jgi:two-component system CheB/CheR fusion protein
VSTSEPTPQADAIADTPHPFLVVGVGASAGGLEAFKELLGHLPANPGLALLYVQHLQPNSKSLLPELLAPVSRMPVREAAEGMSVEKDHVYLIPPNTTMTLHDGQLTLTPRPPGRAPHMPIDHLFRSLAEIQKARAVGVILSGTGTDGSLGFQAIKAEGGITFAQDERSARYDSMPRSAVADGSLDYVLPPREISRELERLANHSYTIAPEAVPVGESDGTLQRILDLLRGRTSVDFIHYKRTTIVRRIRRRMALRGIDTMQDYLRLLEENSSELQDLYQDFLIRVTRFFRDEAVFDAIREQIFPIPIPIPHPFSGPRSWRHRPALA